MFRHLRDTQMTYLAHLRFAAKVGGLLVYAGLACLVHAVLPCCFADTASRTISRLNTLITQR